MITIHEKVSLNKSSGSSQRQVCVCCSETVEWALLTGHYTAGDAMLHAIPNIYISVGQSSQSEYVCSE